MKLRQYFPLFWIALAGTFHLAGYEFVRSPSNTLFKAKFGVEGLPYAMATMPFIVFLVIAFYNKSLRRWGAAPTLLGSVVLSISFLMICAFGINHQVSWMSLPLYYVREAYVVLLIEQFWSFINSFYSDESAKKMNGWVTGFTSLGAIGGGVLLSDWVIRWGTPHMIYVGALLLVPVGIFCFLAYRSAYAQFGYRRLEPETSRDTFGWQAFQRNPVLIWILIVILVTQALSASLMLSFQNELQKAFSDPDLQTAYSGAFFAKVNFGSGIFQFLMTPLLFHFLSLRFIHWFLPIIHVFSIGIFLIEPSLQTASFSYLLFKSIDYSLFRNAKERLYIPLSFEARYQSKQWIDTFGYRVGKGGTSFLVIVLQKMSVPLHTLSGAVALIGALSWFGSSLFMMKEDQKNRTKSPSLKV